jgi:mono/diheme cytochrome c family protein
VRRVVVTLALVALAGCNTQRYAGFDNNGGNGATPGMPDLGGGPSPDVRCDPAKTSLPLPARSELLSSTGTGGGGPMVMLTRDLYEQFKSSCGACHVEASLGGFHVTQDTFATLVGQNALTRIKSDDPTMFMPPQSGGGKPYSMRGPTDPIVQLYGLLSTWIAQGSPKDEFVVGAAGGDGPSPYHMSDWTIDHLTNLGDCIPSRTLVATRATHMDDRDAFFAAATTLPDSLADTDLDTLDGAQLAAEGVIGYAPNYPLWTDDAGKLRFVRVPRGQAIAFDPAKQSFTIPANTRFYKTFMRKVVDARGFVSWRKIETRLIVSRPDNARPDGSFESTALYGTYVWNDDETEAHLSRDPLRDGTPFRDKLITVTVDEPMAKAIIDSHPSDLTYELEEANVGVVRRYAIPGSARCVQCHMGREGFVLGFTPLQLLRRKSDEGGVYESGLGDEMTQLDRLIDYGVISGMSSPADVTPLEKSQGSRAPRNEFELRAQAYMLGNCAHCHNPRGFPSVANPELVTALNFYPGPDGGIFQFPLERTSPLRRRGANLDTPIPYITPSLREYPVSDSSTDNWVEKWTDCSLHAGDAIYQPTGGGLVPYGPVCASNKGVGHYSAPWRSLIYRNVETPFSYADDFVIFPHMPMNSPGFDCRAPKLLGEWMVSIPARRISTVDENAVPIAGVTVKVDDNPQPYVEVAPGDAGYDDAVRARDARLQQYRASPRYGFCPDNRDIVDHDVTNGLELVPAADPVYDRIDPTKMLQPAMGVPARAHWVNTDLTELPGDWFPRRSDWEKVIVEGQIDPSLSPADKQAQQDLVATLQTVTLGSDIAGYALTEVPFGLWQQKPGCDFSKDPKASSFTGAARPAWLDKSHAPADAPVYMQSPGAAVFTTVCINCHGPKADSHGLLSDAILMMTGGDARVANLRDGLFGPTANPGANRARVFGPSATASASADDWAARYLAWMTLGGTQRRLPPALLNIVAATRVFGATRASNQISPTGSPNMLKLAKELCLNVLPAVSTNYELTALLKDGHLAWGDQTGLIDVNGDAEMWLRLCSLGNRPVVRVPYVTDWTVANVKPMLAPQESLWWADAYPSTAPVLDHHGQVVNGVTADNLFPRCVRKPTDPTQLAAADAFLAAQTVKPPYCPPELFAGNEKWKLQSDPNPDGPTLPRVLTDARKWSVRGAINAALAVFLYLDGIEHGKIAPKPPFNQCDKR